MERKKKEQARSDLRAAAQGTGDRSDKIRTYNFPQVGVYRLLQWQSSFYLLNSSHQDRVTDHRVSRAVSGVERVLSGEHLMDIVEELIDKDQKEKIEHFVNQNKPKAR